MQKGIEFLLLPKKMKWHVGVLHETPKQKSSNGDPHESQPRSFLIGALPQLFLLKNTISFKLQERSYQNLVAFELATRKEDSLQMSHNLRFDFWLQHMEKSNPRVYQQHLLKISPPFLQLLPLNFPLTFSQIFFLIFFL